MATFKACSLNCTGLKDYSKRSRIFDRLKSLNFDIVFLQDVHVTSLREANKWGNHWGGRYFWSFGGEHSCGVGILLHPKFECIVKSYHHDSEGRFQYVDIQLLQETFRLINVYAPNKDKERKLFLKSLLPYISVNSHVIWAGDFNFVDNLRIDKFGGNPEYGDIGKDIMKYYKHDFGFFDPFRKLHPTTLEVTWLNPNGTIGCRLDRFYLSRSLTGSLESAQSTACMDSDHSFVDLEFNINFVGEAGGPGYWKANTKVLFDVQFEQDFLKLWQELDAAPLKTSEWWEQCKLRFKDLIISHSKRIARAGNAKLFDLEKQLRLITLTNTATGGLFNDMIKDLKGQIQELLNVKLEGAKVRSRARMLDCNEKPTKYFLRREKKRASDKFIKSLTTEEGSFSRSADLINICTNFYSDLYAKEPVDPNLVDHFLMDVPRLCPEDANICEGPITKAEVWDAIKSMSDNKAPGLDGLPREFYYKYFPVFADSFVAFVNMCFEESLLSLSQRSGLITLICKNPEKAESLSNWRPISLLNVDYKIISKCLTNRLKKVMGSIVHLDQTCAVTGRSILDNAHLLRSIADYCEEKNVCCGLLSLDQSKAFDRVSHEYLFKALEAYGFGPTFIKWVRLLYTDISSAVVVNGFISNSFPILRSVRQGCSLSPLLYVLCIEPFAIKIRCDPHIQGLSLPGTEAEARISLYADDTTIIFTSLPSVQKTMLVLELFGLASGSKLNRDKCQGVWLGGWRDLAETPCNLNWTSDFIKIVGVYLGRGQYLSKNWEVVLGKFQKSLQLSADRFLSFRGRATLVNVSCLSKLWYVGSVLHLQGALVPSFNKAMFAFIWQNKVEAIQRTVLYNSLADGGLELASITYKLMSFHILHLQRLLNLEEDVKWKYFAIYWIGINLRKFQPSLASNLVPHSLSPPPFYCAVLKSLRELLNIKPDLVFGTLSTKVVYWEFVNSQVKRPHIESKHPQIDFDTVWSDINWKWVDPSHRDLAWRAAHNVLPVQARLFHFNITNDQYCSFCHLPEDVLHVFCKCPRIRNLWLFVEAMLTKMADRPVKLSNVGILFCKVKADYTGFKDIMLIMVNCAKVLIWNARCELRFENRAKNGQAFVSLFKCLLSGRCNADFYRLNKVQFKKIWCLNNVICTMDENDGLCVKL